MKPSLLRVASRRSGCLAAALMFAAMLAACGTPTVPTPDAKTVFEPAHKSDRVEFSSPAELAELEAPEDLIHRLGPGDAISIQVWGRPELSGRSVIGPDGRITLPIEGPVRIANLSRDEASDLIAKRLGKYYESPAVTVAVELYTSNKVTVLGRVQAPGPIPFDSPPTLLEVLAKAGALPVIDKQATLTRCAIFRGRDKVIWVDIKRALNEGLVAYNLRMRPGDIVYIPDSSDTMVYVLGEVMRPGAYRLTPDMSLMDALAQAGGPNEDASPEQIGIYRPSRKSVERVPLSDLMTRRKDVNFALAEGDILFVPKSGIAEFGYVTRQLAAGISLLTVQSMFQKSSTSSGSSSTTTNAASLPTNPGAAKSAAAIE